MKKTISTILVCVLLIGTIFSLASCEIFGLVIGTYSDGTTTYEFSGKEVTITTETKIGNTTLSNSKSGEYKIGEDEDGRKTIAITISDNDGDSTTTTYFFNTGKDDNGSYIELTVDLGILGESKTKYYKK